MRIPQNPGGDRTDDSLPRFQYLIPESQIVSFVESLRVRNVPTVTLRLSTIALAIVEMSQNHRDGKSNQTDLLLIREIAQGYKNKQYRLFTDSIIAALEPGKERFSSALVTIAFVVELLQGGHPLYSPARQFYKELLEEITDQEGEK